MALKAATIALRLAPGRPALPRSRPQRAARSLKVATVVTIIATGDAHCHVFALSCTRCWHDEDCSRLAR